MKRIKSYGSGAFIICIIYVEDMFEAEAILKKVFKQKFQLVRGSEYFRGDITHMRNLFVSELNKYNFKNNNTDDEDSINLNDIDDMDSCEDSDDPEDPGESVPVKKVTKKRISKNKIRPVFKCEKCGHEFTTRWNLKKHIERKTPCEPIVEIDSDDPLTCRYCGRKYGYEANLNRHIINSCKVFKNPNIKKQHIQKKKKQEEYIQRLENEIEQLRKKLNNQQLKKGL